MIFGGRQLKKFSRKEGTSARAGLAKSLAILCLLGSAVSAAASGPGYLRAVGPAPLRFWSPPKRTPESLVANPVPAAAAPATVPNPNSYDFMNAFGAQPPLVMEATSTSGPSPMAPIMPPDQPAPANSNVNGSSTNAPAGDVVSPQMLLEYFPNNNRKGGNRNGGQGSIYVPVDPNAVINQTQQPPPRPSSATYSN